jgi:mRNA (guanine-N7-)-methyltransferase
MDPRNVKRMCMHYDRAAQAAPRGRDQGASKLLKEFHNSIKRELIQEFAFNAPRTADLCCGRGGDLHKWSQSGIRHVLAVDISPQELEEAKRRYRAMRPPSMSVEWSLVDSLGIVPIAKPPKEMQCQTVTCMFALHYFAASEKSMDVFLESVSNLLANDGYFVGCCPDGAMVVEALGPACEIVTPVLSIKCHWNAEKPLEETFGNAYTFSLDDTVTDIGGSTEYLVSESALIERASKHGLVPVRSYQARSLAQTISSEGVFRRFLPPDSMESSLSMASRLNAAFVFQKKQHK